MSDLTTQLKNIFIEYGYTDEAASRGIALVREHGGQGDYMEGWDEGCKAERQRCIDVIQADMSMSPIEKKIAIKAIKALEGEGNKNLNLKNWKYCHKHGGIGFVSDCVECNKDSGE